MTTNAMNYAKVLFDLKVPEEVVQNTKEIVTKSKELFNALSNPAVKNSEKHKVIDAIFEKDIRNFLKILIDNDNMDLISQIFEMYEGIVLENKNIIKATFKYVTIPDDKQLEKIKEFICNKYNKAGVLLELKEEPSLLGGFILSVGDVEYDKSIKGTLLDLSKTLVWR